VACYQYLGNVWHVATTGDDVTGDGSEELPFGTIQHGIDVAYEGDTVQVHDGTYTGDGNRDIDFGGTNLVLMSENGPEVTIIDCEGTESDPHRGFLFETGEDSTSIIDGMTIRSGHALGDFPVYPHISGGALACLDASSPTFIQCVFDGNQSAGAGGAVGIYQSTPRFEDCHFVAGHAYDGGALFVAASGGATIYRCTFVSNEADGGGGAIRVEDTAFLVVDSCSFSTNRSIYNEGGALSLYSSANYVINDCVFDGNIGNDHGGAIKISAGSLQLSGCRLSGNLTNHLGGAIYIASGSVTAVDCEFSSNEADEGGAIASYGLLGLNRCTIASNAAYPSAGLYIAAGSYTVDQTIIAFNRAGAAVYGVGGAIQCTDIFGNDGGDWVGAIADQNGIDGNISVDPLFCDTSDADYHLQSNSPCHPDSGTCSLYGALGVGCYGNLITAFAVDGESSLGNLVNHEPVFHWSYDPIDGFSQTSFEMAIGTDEDWTVAEVWEPGEITSSDTSVTYDGVPLIDGTTYYLRLRLKDGTNWSAWYNTSFRLNSLPSVPVALSPIDDEVVGNQPALWVQNSADAEGDTLTYDFFVVVDTLYGEPDPHEGNGIAENPDSTGWTVTAPLDDNKRYWWRSRAFDGYEYSDWTDLYSASFFVDGTPESPTAPTPSWPPDTSGLPVWDMLPTFTWGGSFDPDPYDSVLYLLEIAIDSGFSFVNTTDSISTTEHTIDDSLDFDTQYWWRVSAYDIAGHVTQSESDKQFWTWTLGDLDHNHDVDIADLIFLVTFMFQEGQEPNPHFTADINGDCTGPDIADLIHLVSYMFQSGPEPGVECTDALKLRDHSIEERGRN